MKKSRVVEESKKAVPRVLHVSDQDVCRKRLPRKIKGKGKGLTLPGFEVEASGHDTLFPLVHWFDGLHGVVATAYMAFQSHYPLQLGPQHFASMIQRATTQHVKLHSERLRGVLVDNPDNIELRVDRQFVRGSDKNDWPGVFAEFATCIQAHANPQVFPLFDTAFSSSCPEDRVSGHVALMDTMQSYFKYTLYTMCGIPEVHLEGTDDDWAQLNALVAKLPAVDPDNKTWTEWVQKVSDRLSQVSSAPVWKDFFKWHERSGSARIDGWIKDFFLYEEDGSTLVGDSLSTGTVPNGISNTPMKWEYYEQVLEMRLMAGVVGVGQSPKTGALRPVVGWCVCEK